MCAQWKVIPEWPQSSQKPEDPEYAENATVAAEDYGDEEVEYWDEDKDAIHDVPPTSHVCFGVEDETLRHHFQAHLNGENDGEDVIGDGQEYSLLSKEKGIIVRRRETEILHGFPR